MNMETLAWDAKSRKAAAPAHLAPGINSAWLMPISPMVVAQAKSDTSHSLATSINSGMVGSFARAIQLFIMVVAMAVIPGSAPTMFGTFIQGRAWIGGGMAGLPTGPTFI